MADISSHFQEAIEFIGELEGLNVVPGSPVYGVQLFNYILIVRGYTEGLCLNLNCKKSQQNGVFLFFVILLRS